MEGYMLDCFLPPGAVTSWTLVATVTLLGNQRRLHEVTAPNQEIVRLMENHNMSLLLLLL